MRPSKTRKIEHLPACRLFRPAADMDARMEQDSVALGLDMLEAMRLVNLEGLSREDAARSMNVSSPTLCRMLGQGRRRIAPALRAGKTIPIEGGNIMYATERHGQHRHGFGRGRNGHGTCDNAAAETRGNAHGPAGMGHGHGGGHGGMGRAGHCLRNSPCTAPADDNAAKDGAPAIEHNGN